MGNSQSIPKVNFEDVQFVLKNNKTYVLLNTLNDDQQSCLISHTVLANQEESLINKLLSSGKQDINIIVYGSNSNDLKTTTKCTQLTSLGFYNVFLYSGGLFEWLLLQDIYGEKEFPTSTKQLDILKYKPNKILNIPLIEY